MGDMTHRFRTADIEYKQQLIQYRTGWLSRSPTWRQQSRSFDHSIGQSEVGRLMVVRSFGRSFRGRSFVVVRRSVIIRSARRLFDRSEVVWSVCSLVGCSFNRSEVGWSVIRSFICRSVVPLADLSVGRLFCWSLVWSFGGRSVGCSIARLEVGGSFGPSFCGRSIGQLVVLEVVCWIVQRSVCLFG